ncbi:MAG: hypothetical protein UHI54_05760, partial [Bifidobacterium merycicum]|uniref:hypothetical protein n=1 Tax=Bifidobacterium merycicum TaxID=78345 RepID=UPI002E792B19
MQVTNREQITGRLLKMPLKVLYVPIHILHEDLAFCQELATKAPVCAVLPRIVHDGELPALKQAMVDVKALGVREVLVGNLGLLVPAQEC